MQGTRNAKRSMKMAEGKTMAVNLVKQLKIVSSVRFKQAMSKSVIQMVF